MGKSIVRYSGKKYGICPICGGANNNCRSIENPKYKYPGWLCMYHRAEKGQTIPLEGNTEFVSGGLTRDGLWGIWYKREQRERPYSNIPKNPKPTRIITSDVAEFSAARFNAEAEIKNRKWRHLTRLVTFRLGDRELIELERRGIRNFKEFPFIRTYPGLGIPVLDHKGRIIAYQVRNLETTDGGRYFWFLPKIDGKPELQKLTIGGAIPIGFYGAINSEDIVICEGYLKAISAHLKYDLNTIGIGSCANICNSLSYELLKYYLHSMPNLQFIYIAPDKDIYTNSRVAAKIAELRDKLTRDFPDIYVNLLSWEQHRERDIDERDDPAMRIADPTDFIFTKTLEHEY